MAGPAATGIGGAANPGMPSFGAAPGASWNVNGGFFSPGLKISPAAQAMLQQLQSQGNQSYQTGQNLYNNQVVPGYENIAAGGAAPISSAMSQATLDPIAAKYGSLEQGLGELSGRTRNAAGETAGMLQLARNAGTGISSGAANLEQQAQQNRMSALGGMAGVGGSELNNAQNLYGTMPSMAKATEVQTPSIMSDIGQVAGLVGNVAGIASGMPSFGGFQQPNNPVSMAAGPMPSAYRTGTVGGGYQLGQNAPYYG